MIGKRRIKRILSILLVCLMVLSSPLSAYAANDLSTLGTEAAWETDLLTGDDQNQERQEEETVSKDEQSKEEQAEADLETGETDGETSRDKEVGKDSDESSEDTEDTEDVKSDALAEAADTSKSDVSTEFANIATTYTSTDSANNAQDKSNDAGVIDDETDPQNAIAPLAEEDDLNAQTTAGTYEVSSADEFPSEIAEDQTYILTQDITLTDQQITTLAGTLDGQGHVITLSGKALATTVTGTIQNLGVKGSVTVSSGDSGSMALTLSGTIRNSYSQANVTNTGWNGNPGGLAGTLASGAKIQNCYYAGNAKDSFGITGGMVATASAAGSTISNSYSMGIKLAYSGSGYTNDTSDQKDETTFKSSEMIALLNANMTDTGYEFAYSEGNYPVLQKKSGGSEEPSNVIDSAEDLPTEIAEGDTYILTQDITLTDQQITTLAGTLDGQGHVITLSGKALAATVTGTIQNLGVKGSVTVSSGDSGSMALTLSGTIRNSYSQANVTNTGWNGNPGGLAGTLASGAKIQNCYYAGNAKDSFGITGGMVATASAAGSTISNSYSMGIKLAYSGSGYTNDTSDKKDETTFKSSEMITLLNANMVNTGYEFAYSEGSYPVLQKKTGGAEETVDWSELEAAIAQTERLKEKDYTAESWAAVAAALTEANAVKANENADQSTIDEAAAALNNAIDALEKKPIREPVDQPEDASQIMEITSAADFNTYAREILNGTTTGKYLILKNDISIDSSYASGFANFTNFVGVLDGQGHSIIFKNASVPLFGGVSYGAVIQNVAFTGTLSIASGSTMGPLGSSFAGYFLNSYSDIQGTNVSGLAGKLSSGAVIANCFVVGDMSGGGAFAKTNEGGVVENTYYVDTLSSDCGTAMSEDSMKTLEFVDTLNSKRGENGIAWGQSSTGYPYFGENQTYVPSTDPYPELPGESLYEVAYTPAGETQAQILGEDHRLQVSPQIVDAFHVSGSFSLVDYTAPEGSELRWSVSSKPSDSFAIAENNGELFVYKNGKAVVTATQVEADGTTTQVAYVSVLATSQTMTAIRLLIDDTDVTDTSYTVKGSQYKQIHVQAKFDDSGDTYKDVAFSGFTFEVGDADLIFSRSTSSNGFYFKKPGTSYIQVTSRQNAELTARVDLTSEYVAVESVMPALQSEYTIHGRNANSDGQEADGRIAYNPIKDTVVVTPSYATNADKVTVAGDNDEIAYYNSGSKEYVPKESGTVTFTATVEDQNPVTGEVNTVTGSKTVTFKYLNPVSSVSVTENEITVESGAQTTLDVAVTGTRDAENYNVTEPALNWTYDTKGIAQIVSKAKGSFKRETGSPDDNMYFPEMEYTVVGLSEGTVTATGTPVDTTNATEAVTVKITVTKGNTPDKDIDAIAAKASESAHSYIADSHSENGYAYGNEWLVYAELRAGKAIDESALDSYYSSVAEKVKTWAASQKPTDIERVVLALAVMDKDITDVDGVNLAEMIYNHPDLAGGSNDLIYALLALDAADVSIPSDAKWSRDSIIAALLKYQNLSSGGFGLVDNKSASVDMTAMALQALANYQNKPEVTSAIEKALEYLKSQQQDDFGYGTAESTAQVLIALSLLNIDPTSAESGFGTPNFNIITNLQEYQNADGGFSHLAGSDGSVEMSTVQALQALDAYQQSKTGVSYWNVKGLRVTITLLGDDVHNSDADGHAHTLLAGNLQTWISETSYLVTPGACVKDLLVKTLEENGFTYEAKYEGSYISSITRNGVTLGEFTNGKYSGWMYTLNGTRPNLSIVQQKLVYGDSIVFYYTDNYNKENPHEHDWVEEWSFDSNSHWHECEGSGADCDAVQNSQKKGFGSHTGSWVVTRKATCTANGTETFKCTVCGYTTTRTIYASGHSFGNWTVATAATALANGVQKRTCTKCGYSEQQSINKLAAKGSLSLRNFPLKVKQSYTLKVNGMAAGDRVVSWKSSNTKIAAITGAGKVTGKKKGNATITATLASGLKLTTTVKVQTGTVKTTSITVNTKNVTLKTKQGFQILADKNPATSQQGITYSTSNKKVVTVTKKGYIKGVKAGTATITVKSGKKSVKIKVKVEGVKTTGLTANKTSVTLKKNKTFAWKVKTVPANSSEKITYSTSNKKVATVSTSGKIKAKKAGTATITAKSGNQKITIKVTVK